MCRVDRSRAIRGAAAGAASGAAEDAAADAATGTAAGVALLGAVLVAPVLHVGYGFLGRRIPGTSVGPVVGRVVLDQALFAPTFIAIFFSALAVSVHPPRTRHPAAPSLSSACPIFVCVRVKCLFV